MSATFPCITWPISLCPRYSTPAARNAVLELGGPETLRQLEVVRIFEEIAGRAFEKQFVPGKALQTRKAAATNPVERTFADLTLAAARGEWIDTRETFQQYVRA